MITGVIHRAAISSASHGQGVRKCRRNSGAMAKNKNNPTIQSGMENFASVPIPTIIPTAIHAHFRSSQSAFSAKQLAAAQQNRYAGSVVMINPPAKNIGV